MQTFQELKDLSKSLRISAMKTKAESERFMSDEVISVLGAAESIAKKELREVTKDDILSAVNKNLKGVKETLSLLDASLAKDLDSEEIRKNKMKSLAEFTVRKTALESLLPKQMTENELENKIVDIIFNSAQTERNKGSILKALKAQFGGQYDNKTAADLATKILSS